MLQLHAVEVRAARASAGGAPPHVIAAAAGGGRAAAAAAQPQQLQPQPRGSRVTRVLQAVLGKPRPRGSVGPLGPLVTPPRRRDGGGAASSANAAAEEHAAFDLPLPPGSSPQVMYLSGADAFVAAATPRGLAAKNGGDGGGAAAPGGLASFAFPQMPSDRGSPVPLSGVPARAAA